MIERKKETWELFTLKSSVRSVYVIVWIIVRLTWCGGLVFSLFRAKQTSTFKTLTYKHHCILRLKDNTRRLLG